MILAQMTESERQIIAQQFADIVECADFERGRSSMLDWEAWIQNYLEDPLTTEPKSGNSSQTQDSFTMMFQVPRTITLDNLVQLQETVVEINQPKNSTECHICDPRCNSSSKVILSILFLIFLFF